MSDIVNQSHKLLSEIIKRANANLYNASIPFNYAKSRGLTPEVIKNFNVGFIPFALKEQIQTLFTFKAAKTALPKLNDGEIEQLLLKNGLVIPLSSKDGKIYYKELFGNRLLIPFYDKDSNPIGIAARRIDALIKENDFKYINSPESEVFHKREMFFNYNNIKNTIKKDQPIVLCEGTFDAIAYFKAGVPAVAGSGIALSPEQIQMLKALPTRNIILSYDNDAAGKEAMLKNYPDLVKAGFNVTFVDYKDTPAKDMDEIVNDKRFGPTRVKQLADNPISEVKFLFDSYLYQATHIETHRKGDNKLEIKEISPNDLTDYQKYKIFFDVQQSLYKNHDYKISQSDRRELENLFIVNLGFDLKQSQNVIKSFIDLSKSRPARVYRYIKTQNQQRIIPQWKIFENDKTIHDVLSIIGAQKEFGKTNFYRSLWNNDTNASMSVKRGRNLWKDFSSGRSGGIYQLVSYLDLTDPNHPQITENPNQTSKIQAYNWLIKQFHLNIPLATAIDTADNFTFTQLEKEYIDKTNKYFDKYNVCDIPAYSSSQFVENLSNKSSPEQTKEFVDCFGKLNQDKILSDKDFHSILVKSTCPGCPTIFSGVSHFKFNPSSRSFTLADDSPSFHYIGSNKDPKEVNLIFDTASWDQILAPQKTDELKTPSVIIPQNPQPEKLFKYLKDNFQIINIVNPNTKWLSSNFDLLSSLKKPIFVNGVDLYKQAFELNIARYTDIVKAMAHNSPSNIFQQELLFAMDQTKGSNKYFQKLFEKELKNKDTTYPPKSR